MPLPDRLQLSGEEKTENRTGPESKPECALSENQKRCLQDFRAIHCDTPVIYRPRVNHTTNPGTRGDDHGGSRMSQGRRVRVARRSCTKIRQQIKARGNPTARGASGTSTRGARLKVTYEIWRRPKP